MYTHHDYLNDKVTHREYYAQFVDDDVLDTVSRCIGERTIVASTDEHLNDIPLHRWDNLPIDFFVQQKMKEIKQGYSLSDKVCVAKEAAKQIQERHGAIKHTGG